MRKKRLLVYSTNGYNFVEYFYSMINDLSDHYEIDLVQVDFFLTNDAKSLIKKLQKEKKINNFYLVKVSKSPMSARYNIKVLKLLMSNSYSLSILGSDSDLFARALHFFCQKNNICRLYIGTGTERPMLQPLLEEQKTKINTLLKKYSIFQIGMKLLPHLRNVGKNLLHKSNDHIENMIYRICGIELINFNAFAHKSSYVDLMNYNYVIFFYRPVYKAAKKLFPDHLGLKYLKLDFSNKDAQHVASKGLLVCFSQNISNELPDEKIDLWVERIKSICELKKMSKLTLRFHPRMCFNLKWPSKLRKALEKDNINVNMDYAQKSIMGRQNEYQGILGSPSGVFYPFIFSDFNGFILCMVRMAEEGFDDTEDLMGDIDRLNYIYPDSPSIKLEDLENKPLAQMNIQCFNEFMRSL